MDRLKFLKERLNEYNSNFFVNELFIASKKLGILEEKLNSLMHVWIEKKQ